MGRMKYTRDERASVISVFLKATREIIDAQGVAAVSIRAVANKTGYSSASLYLYFKDLDQLISMASMSYLRAYCRELAQCRSAAPTARELYLDTWRLLCKYAFMYPNVFRHLFFTAHGSPLGETVAAYCRLLSDGPGESAGELEELLSGGTMEERSAAILSPLVSGGTLSEQQARLIIGMTVGYFRLLLDEVLAGGGIDADSMTRRQLRAMDFLLDAAIKKK